MKKNFTYGLTLIFVLIVGIIVGGCSLKTSETKADDESMVYKGCVQTDYTAQVITYKDTKNNNIVYITTNSQWNNVAVDVTAVPIH